MPAFASDKAKRIVSANTITWVGVDYTAAQFVSNLDFRDEAKVVGEYPEKWNLMVLAELLDTLGARSKKLVQTDISGVMKANKSCTTKQIIREEGGSEQTVLSEAIISKKVGAYELKTTQGLGFVIVVDKLVKLENTGCAWPVFFDVMTREILHTERICNDAKGFGFRNYWFNPVKTIIHSDLKGMMKNIRLQSTQN